MPPLFASSSSRGGDEGPHGLFSSRASRSGESYMATPELCCHQVRGGTRDYCCVAAPELVRRGAEVPRSRGGGGTVCDHGSRAC